MLNQITDEEIEFLECFFDPICFAESMFTNGDNMGRLEEGELGNIRIGQFPLFSFEYTIEDDDSKTEQENFTLREGAGNIYLLGGRNFGKTFTEKIDTVMSLTHTENYPMGFTSYDAIHIRGVLEPIIDCFENHPIIHCFKKPHGIKRSPSYHISSLTGSYIDGINMNIASKTPGSQFFQKHYKKIIVEEASFETEEVYRKRIDSKHEIGCIERVSGMTNFTKYSPAGRAFYDLTKKPWVINLPQFINPFWNKEEKKKSLKKHGGEGSAGYRIFVKGEVVEEGVSVFDMARVRPFYLEGKKLKQLEVNKESFHNFEEILNILERADNSEQVYICSDIGESAPTEIIILFKVNETFRHLYNVTLYNLTDKEQFKIFKYIATRLSAECIGLDTSDGTGRAIYRSLEEIFPRENLCWVGFNEKIKVDFLKDENGNSIFKDGKPEYVQEYVSEWSVKNLKNILYSGKVEIPEDSYKFDSQVNSVVAMQSGNRTIYKVIADEDHHFQAWQVFSIAHWNNEFNILKPIARKNFSKFGV